MNLPLLASEIVRRVHHSPDSVTNLETLVAQIIREEMNREGLASLGESIEKADQAIRNLNRHRTED